MDSKLFEELVEIERCKQDTKWGEQNHPVELWLAILMEEVGELSRCVNEYHSQSKYPSYYKGVDLNEFENEIIQIAAVCKAMWECGQRNGWFNATEAEK